MPGNSCASKKGPDKPGNPVPPAKSKKKRGKKEISSYLQFKKNKNPTSEE
jgi:hypothetical protein